MMNGAAWQNAPDLLKLGLTLFTVSIIVLVFMLWLTGWRWLAAAFAAIGILVILGFGKDANAKDLDGRHANSPLKPWFDSLQSRKGPCCSDADGFALSDVDWETKGGKYRVRVPRHKFLPSKETPAPPQGLEMMWVDVEDDAVITEPNRAGRTMVWPLWGGFGPGPVIRCFMPGSMT